MDDQPDDQAVLTQALRRIGVRNRLLFLRDGHEAILYFNGDPLYSDRVNYPLPAVLFLDLRLPGANGWEVLDWLHGTGSKGDCHIFIYSRLNEINGLQRAYSLGADSFLKKPLQEINLANLIRHFPKPWETTPLRSFENAALAQSAKGEVCY